MSEKNEIITTHDHQIETSVVEDIPAEVALPPQGERLVIGASPKTESEQGQSGLEVVSLAGYPRDEKGNIDYNGIKLSATLSAIIIDPMVMPNFAEGTGFKGLRKDEVVSSQILSQRFGKESSFSLGLDQDGKVMVENADATRPVNILSIKPLEKEATAQDTSTSEVNPVDVSAVENELVEEALITPEASAELHAEAADDLGETATENLVEMSENPVEVTPETPVEEAIEAPESSEEDPAKEKLPEPSAGEKIAIAKAEYDRRVDQILDATTVDAGRLVRTIEDSLGDAAQNTQTGTNMLADDVQTLRTLAMHIEDGNYTTEMSRTKLTQLVDTVQGAYRRFALAEESLTSVRRHAVNATEALDEAKNAMATEDYNFAGFVHEAVSREAQPQLVEVPSYSTEEVTGILTNIDSQIGEVAALAVSTETSVSEQAGSLRLNVNRLGNILNDSYSGRIDTQELRSIAAQLQGVIEDNQARTLVAQVEENLSVAKQGIRRLAPDSE